MFNNAIFGMFTSLFFAGVVLIITTNNYIVGLQAVLSIMLTFGTIMSCIKLAGWSLGIAESIGLIVFVGFSVDYIVHMCHQYVESVYERRKKRMDSCFTQFGSTIINGAITSFMAGFFLSKCQVSFLYKFGILMQFTIASALLFSLIFYPAFGYLLGPQFRQGDIMYNFINPIKLKYKKYKEKKA